MKDALKNHRKLYLARYAAAEASAAGDARGAYQYVLSIPVFDEDENFLERVLPSDVNDLLVIVVVNAPDGLARTDPAVVRTRSCLDLGGALHRGRNVDVTIVDRVTEPIPARQGVGLARKIGADLALRYISEGRVDTPVIFSTDADVTLPPGYFQAPEKPAAAWVFPYTHTSDDVDLARRALAYELAMRYYVDRLEYAGSPFAYHALGSCLALDATAYAQVRGFPRRNAAEDFYVLNKLAKIGGIRRLTEPVIEIEARLSTRVPFGTGPALAKIPSETASLLGYAGATFDVLKSFHAAIARGDASTFEDPIPHLLDAIGYAKFGRATSGQRAFHTWFDAFKTLKFVHAARNLFPDAPLLETLKALYPNADTIARMNTTLRQNEVRMPAVKGIPP